MSAIGFGSVELGMDYGIKVPGKRGRPNQKESEGILQRALDSGINFFDTAPSYGDSERLLGAVIGSKPCYIATKVNVDEENGDVGGAIRASIENSLRNFNRECLDIVQIHNMEENTRKHDDALNALGALQKKGLVRFLGTSLYGPRDVLSSVQKDFFDVLQIAYNILDQRTKEEIIPMAEKENMGIVGRSAYFRGMLTERVQYLDENWNFFKKSAKDIKTKAGIDSWDDLSKLALKFCLSTKELDTVLVGVQTMDELEFAVKAAEEENLSEDIFEKLLAMKSNDEYWLNPLNWYLKL